MIGWSSPRTNQDNLNFLNASLLFLSFNKSFFFNTLCVFIFIGMLGFVYFKFLKADPNTKLELGSLKYTISDEFTLSCSASSSR